MLISKVVRIGRLVSGRYRGTRLVVASRILGLEHARQDKVKERVIGIGHALVVAPVIATDLHLVVAAPDHQARVMRQTPHLVRRLAGDIGQELLVDGRVFGAGKHELLPDKDAFGIADIVELVALINAAAPDTQEIAVRLQGAVHQRGMTIAVRAAQDQIHGHIVAPLAEDRLVIDLDDEILPLLRMRILVDPHMAEPEPACG